MAHSALSVVDLPEPPQILPDEVLGNWGPQEPSVCVEGAKKEPRGTVSELDYSGSRPAESHPRLCTLLAFVQSTP